jgi:predicted transcriptional regulator
MTGRTVAVGVAVIGDGDIVLLQVGDDWHLVVSRKDASVIAKLLHDAAHGELIAAAAVTDLHAGGVR